MCTFAFPSQISIITCNGKHFRVVMSFLALYQSKLYYSINFLQWIMDPAGSIHLGPPCVVFKNMFLFPLWRTEVWPLCLLFFYTALSLPLPCSHTVTCPLSVTYSLSLPLCVRADNVSANDLTVFVVAPSSNWTSRDWVLYRKTIVIFISYCHRSEIQQTQSTVGLGTLCRLLRVVSAFEGKT